MSRKRKPTGKPPTKWRGHLEGRIVEDCVEVWLPPLDDPEGELVLNLNRVYVPDLISVLKVLK